MLIPIGIFASSGARATGAFDLLESTVLTGSQATVSFTNLVSKYAATYQHLQLRVVGRNSRSQEWAGVLLRFNADSGANYAAHALRGDGGGVFSSANTSATSINNGSLEMAGSGQASGVFSPLVYDILDPFETKNKTVRYFGGRGAVSSSDRQIGLFSGAWFNTTSVTSISLTASPDGNFVAGSRFSLYGIRSVA